MRVAHLDCRVETSPVQVSARSAGHLVLKPFVQDRRPKTPESADLDSRDLAVACHFLESLGMDLQESCGFVTVEQLFEGQFTNLRLADCSKETSVIAISGRLFMQLKAARAA